MRPIVNLNQPLHTIKLILLSNKLNAAFAKANTSVIKTGDSITGIVTSPTAATGTSNTMIATTQFVNNEIAQITPSSGINQTLARCINFKSIWCIVYQ
jgi:hypothetical protein